MHHNAEEGCFLAHCLFSTVVFIYCSRLSRWTSSL